MQETSLSLLNHLRSSSRPEDWDRLVELYSPLLTEWLRKYDVQDNDAADLTQDVLIAVAKDVGSFEPRFPGAFRGWLKAILVNRLRKFWRARDRRPQAGVSSELHARLEQLDDPSSQLSLIWNREHDQYVLKQLLTMTEPHFTPGTWTAFRRVALDGARPEEVAEELGISRNAVIITKCRILNRLRVESEGLIESSSVFSSDS